MRIFVIANGYPSSKDPQFGCFEKDQAYELNRLGHDVTILYIDGRFRRYWRKLGISHYKQGTINIYGIYIFPLFIVEILSYKLSFKFRSYLLNVLFKHVLSKHNKPDLIYAHYCYNIANAITIGKKHNIPVVGIEHWSVMNQELLSRKAQYIGSIAYYNADRIISVSSKLALSLKNHFGINPLIVNDMIGDEFVNQRLIEQVSPKRVYRFISVGSLFPIKGFDMLIEAFSLVAKSVQQIELVIIGGGPELKKLKKLILSLSLSSKVRLLGRKNKKEIIENLLISDCFCVSSKSETFGVACAEALALGLPVISTACGGPEEFINGNNGIIINGNNPLTLANAMLQMYKTKDQYDKQAIAKECRAKFAPRVIATKLNTIFEETLTNYSTQK